MKKRFDSLGSLGDIFLSAKDRSDFEQQGQLAVQELLTRKVEVGVDKKDTLPRVLSNSSSTVQVVSSERPYNKKAIYKYIHIDYNRFLIDF
jgi:hypothetical protein